MTTRQNLPVPFNEAAARLVLAQAREILPALNRVVSRALTLIREAVDGFFAGFRRFREGIEARANDPVRVAGLEARYSVTAGLDPAYRIPEQRDALVWSILVGEEPGTVFLTPANRGLVAAAAIRGWVSHYGPQEPLDALAWIRLIGATAVEVRRG